MNAHTLKIDSFKHQKWTHILAYSKEVFNSPWNLNLWVLLMIPEWTSFIVRFRQNVWISVFSAIGTAWYQILKIDLVEHELCLTNSKSHYCSFNYFLYIWYLYIQTKFERYYMYFIYFWNSTQFETTFTPAMFFPQHFLTGTDLKLRLFEWISHPI